MNLKERLESPKKVIGRGEKCGGDWCSFRNRCDGYGKLMDVKCAIYKYEGQKNE